jgi:protein arginine N-methyltransferase 1
MATVVDRDIFGSQEIAYECLADVDRTRNFKAAIDEVVNATTTVLEMGTGTGILSIFAAQAGAPRVIAYEISKPMAQLAAKNVADNRLSGTIDIRTGDVTTLPRGDEQFDVVVAEMISVGLIEEQLVPAFNHVLARGLLTRLANSIPSAQDTFAELVCTDFEHFGVVMKTPQIEQTWQASKLRRKMTAPLLIAHVDFDRAIREREPIPPLVDQELAFTAENDGTVNAIRLTSNSVLSPSISSGWTQCMNSPAIVPTKEFAVVEGQTLGYRIHYEMGGEMKTFFAERI